MFESDVGETAYVGEVTCENHLANYMRCNIPDNMNAELAKILEDFADDEAGLLPNDLKRGVLSKDGLFNLLERYREKDA